MIREWMSARRMKLRDKGPIEATYENEERTVTVHKFCNTRVRIGINQQSAAVRYCWRCEQIFGLTSSFPGGGLPREPEAQEDATADMSNVVTLQVGQKN